MAIANSDGSIILTTKVDDSGINKGMSQIQGKASSLTKTFKSLAGAIGLAFSVSTIVQFSKQAGQFATQTEASVQRLVDIYGEASGAVADFIDQNSKEIGLSKSAGASIASTYGNLLSVWADQETNATLTNSLLNQTAVVASKTGRTVEDVAERVRSGLLGNTEAIEDLGINVNIKTIEITDAFKRIANGRSWEQLNAYEQAQVRALAILEQSTNKYGNTVMETSATIRNRYNAAYEDFKNSWGNIVNTVLLPVLKTVTQIFDIATKGLNAIAGVSGKVIENAKIKTADTANNIKKQTKEQEKLNKAVKKGLANFDEINTLTEETLDNEQGGGTNSPISPTDETTPDGSAYEQEANRVLMAIMGTVGLAMVAVGLILMFTGNVAWGAGFIIAGAAVVGVTMAAASAFDYSGTTQMLTTIMGIAGGALLALGIILLWLGGVVGKGVAIGMIIAGSALIVSAVAAQAAFAPEDIAAWLSLIMGIAGGALLALGIILCMAGSTAIGVGMIIAGSVAIVSAVALNFDSVTNLITGWVAVIMGIVGGAALVIGIILCATGAAVGLGIALIAVGAVLLATPIALNWESVVQAIQGPIGAIMALVGGALLVIGIILTCTGVFGLGIALMAIGAVSLAAPLALNWNGIVDQIKTFLFENPLLVSLISGGLLVIGIILCFAQQWALGIGLIAIGAVGLAAEIALNWNSIVNAVKTFLFENPVLVSLISGGLLILGIILCVTGVMLPLGIAMIAVGVAGLVTEAVLNWGSIVTSIKTFLFENSELIALISGGLLILGILLCATGIGIPLGIALIAAGAVGLVTVTALNWNSIVSWVQGAWNAVKTFWNTYIAPIFTLAWWTNLAKTCGNGLIAGFESAVNGIIWLFEGMINFVVAGLNLFLSGVDSVISAVGNVFGADWGVATIPYAKLSRVSIPRLAQGAVIPPNREFLAVLGDQKHGTNIEAPLDTIKQAVAEVLAQVNVSGGGFNGRIEVPVVINGREVARAVRDAESDMGSQTVFGGFANAY